MATEPTEGTALEALGGALRRDARARRVHDAVGRADPAALHRGGPAGDPSEIGLPGEYPVHARRLPEHVPRAGCGRCASSRASARPRRPTSASATCSTTGRPGCRTAFDMPSLMGHDSDHPRSLGEVGREGVAIDTLDDMETLFEGIDLGEVTVSMTINAPAAIMLAFYVVAAEENGVAARPARRHDPGRHPQGVHRPEGVVLPGRPGDAAAGRHDRVVRARACRAGTRSRSPATTSARPARPPRRSSRSRSRTASPTSSRRSSAAWTSTTSRRA